MSHKLYYEDPYIKSFKSNIEKQSEDENGDAYIVLEQTAFYPTGGGQPCDTGTINDIKVISVEEINGEIRHYIDGEMMNEDEEVAGEINWDRRYDHMQQHCGQHILSRAIENLYGIETIGFHLGRETVTIDLEIEELTPDMILEAQTLANQIVFENREIKTRWVDYEDLASLPLRKMPAVTDNIRLVIIDKFDFNGCGGTHPARTGEVGPIKILDMERHKKNTRLQFACGWRTIGKMDVTQFVLQESTRMLSSTEEELPMQIEKMINDHKSLEKSLQEVKDQLLRYEAKDLLSKEKESNIIPALFENRKVKELQKLARLIIDQSQDAIVLLVTSNEDKLQFVCASGNSQNMNMNEVAKQVLPLINGRGGGNKEIAQGGGNASLSGEVFLSRLEQLVKGNEH